MMFSDNITIDDKTPYGVLTEGVSYRPARLLNFPRGTWYDPNYGDYDVLIVSSVNDPSEAEYTITDRRTIKTKPIHVAVDRAEDSHFVPVLNLLSRNSAGFSCHSTFASKRGHDRMQIHIKATSQVLTSFDLLQNDPNVGRWDVSGVVDMSYMFYGSPFNMPLNGWRIESAKSLRGMFCDSEYNQPLFSDVSGVKDFSEMFYRCRYNMPLGWKTPRALNMSMMFAHNRHFNQSLSSFITDSVIDMSGMFLDSVFDQSINNWNVGSVRRMNRMFEQSRFNCPLASWDVSKVTDMSNMFKQSIFNQDIYNWQVHNVLNMSGMFEFSEFNLPIDRWEVLDVQDMSFMFHKSMFKQPLYNWKRESKAFNCRNFEGMFKDIDYPHKRLGWNISPHAKVDDMFTYKKD